MPRVDLNISHQLSSLLENYVYPASLCQVFLKRYILRLSRLVDYTPLMLDHKSVK